MNRAARAVQSQLVEPYLSICPFHSAARVKRWHRYRQRRCRLSKLLRKTNSLNSVLVKSQHHKFSCQKIENRTKDESNQRTCEDNDVVGHAEVRRSEIDEQDRSVDTRYSGRIDLEPLFIKRTGVMMGGQVPSTLRIWWMLTVPVRTLFLHLWWS